MLNKIEFICVLTVIKLCVLFLNKSDWLPKTGEFTTSGTCCLNYWIVGPTFSAYCGTVSLDTARNSWVGWKTLTIKSIFWSQHSVTAWLLQLHWVIFRDTEFLRSSVGVQLGDDALVLRGTAPLQFTCTQVQLNQGRNSWTQYNLSYCNRNNIPRFELNFIGVFWCFSDRPSWYNFIKWPIWRTISLFL